MLRAALFDMDGVIVDNHHFHVQAWKLFCDKYNISLTENDFRAKYFGKNNTDILSGLLNRSVSQTEVDELGEEKEELYRKVYKDHVKPVEGLVELLKSLKENGVKIGVATSAPASNLDFVFENIKIKNYFNAVVDAHQIKNGKPNPEIYLKTAEILDVSPADCVVFEDSVSGIQSGQRAGMKVISLITTHRIDELPKTELAINNFTEISVEKIKLLF